MRTLMKKSGAFLIAAAFLLLSAEASHAVTYNLRTGEFVTIMPDNTQVLMWGFGQDNGPITVPGPLLAVPAGDTTLTIHLTNNLTVPVSIVSPQLGLGAAPVPVLNGGRVESFTAAAIPGGGVADFTFTCRPGTFLYESGTDPSVQVQMGLYGTITAAATTGGQAYDDPAGATVPPFDSTVSAFDVERTVVLSEIDPALHTAVQNGTYGGPLYPSTNDYQPKYFLINGRAYNTVDPPTIYLGATAVLQNVLLRFANAGLSTHVPTIQGLHMNQISEGGNLLPYPKTVLALPVEAGMTKDVISLFPDTNTYPLYDRRLNVTNAGVWPGGMIVNVVAADPPPDAVGPITFNVLATPNPTGGSPTVTLTATTSDINTGNSNIAAAEYFIDVDPGVGLGTAMAAADGLFDTPTENLTAVVNVSGLAPGTHTLFVRGQDVPGNWGDATGTILIGQPSVFISLNVAATLSATAFAKGDIIQYNNGVFSRYFTATQAGIPAAANLRAFDIISANELLLSFNGGTNVPGVGRVRGSDIVKFTATSLGTTTTGTFTLHFKGSRVGLTTVGENIDALDQLPNGDILISTTGTASVPVLGSAGRSVILAFTPTVLGPLTAGTWSTYLRGQDVGLTLASENIDGVDVGADGKVYLSTRGNFSVAGVSGEGRDVFVFTPTALGVPTTGTFSPTLHFDGSAAGLGTALVDGIALF